jgi:seryl-tRNA synthetase
MIDIKHLLEFPDNYRNELKRRGGDISVVDSIISRYDEWKEHQLNYEQLRSTQKDFNTKVISLSGEEKQSAIEEMKSISESVKSSESKAKEIKSEIDTLVSKVPSLTWDGIPVGTSDEDNPVTGTYGDKPEYDFDPKPYWELPFYQRTVDQEAGAKAMGARGFYLKGDMALFQRALFDHTLDIVLKHGFEMMYVPLMLNEKVLTGTGHIPDFDGQQYEVIIDDEKSFYLIGSSEPSIMGYYMDTNVGKLEKPILNTCWSSCFRKEAGSYGKDQQGILRVHQFEKIEMVAIAKPEETESLFLQFNEIVEEIYNSLGIHYQSVEVCSGDIPHKHYRQIDYEAWFPGVQRFREVCSSGNASDYQNRGLRVSYQDSDGGKSTPWGLNCTAVTFRTGLAIMEQFQQADGSIQLPQPLADRMNKSLLQ